MRLAEIVRLVVIAARRGGAQDADMANDRTLVMVAYDDFQLLDLAGPTEVFDTATSLGVTPGNQRVVVTPSRRPVVSSLTN